MWLLLMPAVTRSNFASQLSCCVFRALPTLQF